jgi:heme exporter protein B
VLIAAAKASKPLLMPVSATTDLGKWLGFMALYDMVFVLLAVAVFDYLLED